MKENWVYRRGDLYLANLGVPVGSKQGDVRPVVVLQNDVGNYYGQKSLPFLHTFDILEGSGVRHDNKSDNTQCMKRNRRRTHAKKARKMAHFRAFSMLKILAGLFGFMEFEPNNNNRKK